jgi:hypothetical protein
MANRTVINSGTLGASGHTAADNVYFQDNNTPVVTDIDASGLAAGGYNDVVFALACRSLIGSFSAPFKAEISGMLDYGAGGGQCYYDAEGDADTCALMRVRGPGRPRMSVVGGTITIAELSGGITDILESAAATTIRMMRNAILNLPDNGSTDPTLIDAGGGEVHSARGATTIDQRGSALVEIDAGANNITTWTVGGGRALAKLFGTLTTLNWKHGLFDVRQLKGPVTITNTNVWVPDVDRTALDAFLNHPLITFSNAPTLIGESA